LFVVYTERGEKTFLVTVREAERYERRVTMGTITSTIRVGEKPPKEVIKRVKKRSGKV
jgi:putative Ca2+/H+ antiporter (TMEM165/GDT1 family)